MRNSIREGPTLLLYVSCSAKGSAKTKSHCGTQLWCSVHKDGCGVFLLLLCICVMGQGVHRGSCPCGGQRSASSVHFCNPPCGFEAGSLGKRYHHWLAGLADQHPEPQRSPSPRPPQHWDYWRNSTPDVLCGYSGPDSSLHASITSLLLTISLNPLFIFKFYSVQLIYSKHM